MGFYLVISRYINIKSNRVNSIFDKMLKLVCVLSIVAATLALDEVPFKTTSSKKYHVSDITVSYNFIIKY